MKDDEYYLAICRRVIEEKLRWGNSSGWQNQDFANLSDRIFDETRVLLSSSTLKRLWGKVRYESAPNISTLDALARFAGYPNWRDFVADQDPYRVPSTTNQAAGNKKSRATSKQKRNILLGLLLLAVIFVSASLFIRPGRGLQLKEVSFSSKPVTFGVPNTVIFQYNASHSNADSVFIQQSWDPKMRFRVDKQLHEFTSTYYMPGYYRAKLILNDSIVREHDVKIETKGWLGMLENNPIPTYLSPELIYHEGWMGLNEKDLPGLDLDVQKEVPQFTLTRVDSGINVPGDDFFLHTRLQNNYRQSNGICRQTYVALLGTTGVLAIPLCNKGCVGEIGIMIGMRYISGKTNDLSAFGVDFDKEVELQCRVKNSLLEIFINGEKAFSRRFNQDIGRIVGAKIKFNGTGIVREFTLTRTGN
jgi:hypothetical protein